MHEMSLARSILQLVEDAAARERFTRLKRLRPEAGALAGVEVGALRFAMQALAPGTVLAGAEIEIDERPGILFETCPPTGRRCVSFGRATRPSC
jgi:hydrogenase nickel incorporation protein HypA/HybF